MFADDRVRSGSAKRRGVVLILVLGMLALLALIGVTFATFASQSRISARYFAQSASIPDAGDVMDYALSQLINDTDNPLSAIRGHSLKRDMYGNDGSKNGLLTNVNGNPLQLGASSVVGSTTYYATNIPYDASVDPTGKQYNGWILKLAPTTSGFDGSGNPVFQTSIAPTMQSFVVVSATSVPNGSGGFLYAFQLNDSDLTTATVKVNGTDLASQLIQPSATGYPFILDGRYRFAFNGPGVGGAVTSRAAQFGNYRFNRDLLTNPSATSIGVGSPDSFGLDEDYDACDLENWFLAIQSADGKVVVPSFHRPGILSTASWLDSFDALAANSGDATVSNRIVQSMSKILRPKSIDHNSGTSNSFGQAFPDPIDGRSFDVDNDGDGKTDSVWLDLGFPARRNANGKLYKPLFAFMVIGLNGRIPLNTAGNLAASSDSMQASHLGNSVSEVDPTYALQNSRIDGIGNALPQVDNANQDVRTTQLRNLLTGTRPYPVSPNPTNVFASGDATFGDMNYVVTGIDPLTGNPSQVYYLPNGIVDASDFDALTGAAADPSSGTAQVNRLTQAIAGRWGESDSVPRFLTSANFVNRARAGYSRGDRDANDDNRNAFDFFPGSTSMVTRQGEVNDADLYDSSAFPILPVERMRRFVTPADLDGTGRVVQWNGTNTDRYGSDSWGRVAFLNYFRPPGLPGAINPTNGIVFRTSPSDPMGNPPAIDTTNNLFHGYDFYRYPDASRSTQLGGMPSNTGSATAFPTYDTSVATGLNTDGNNDADEMNLYSANGNDQPFGPSDLEWLYRNHDVDGYSLSSRLSQLAPISFTNSVDGLRRRRLFSIDSWELTNSVWANDNPQGGNPNNSRFLRTDNAGFAKVQSNLANLKVVFGTDVATGNLKDPLRLGRSNSYAIDPTTSTTTYLESPVAHRNRKINLNSPLPVSNNPIEPVRQKWIRETYQTLKAILPPKSIDTAEELAQLSQFVVNIIDFRDPDGAMTRFVNTDVTVNLPTAATASPTLTLTPATPPNPYSPTYLPADGYLIQYGMEYNPVAINEVLAYSFMYNRNASSKTSPTYARNNRFFVELVNTLTEGAAKSGNVSASKVSLGGFAYAANDPYSVGSWDLVFTNDDSLSRPDPFTGQLLNGNGTFYGITPLNKDSFDSSEGVDLSLLPLPATGNPSAIANMTPTTNPAVPENYYCVIGNPGPLAGIESYEPKKDNPTPLTVSSTPKAPSMSRLLNTTFNPLEDPSTAVTPPSLTFRPGVLPGVSTVSTTKPPKLQWKIPSLFPIIDGAVPTKTAKKFVPNDDARPNLKYYWVCLRRPANPMAPVDDTNPMVVVDAVRFPYIDATGTVDATNTPPSAPSVTPNGYIAYSVKRWQPYRGGHAVPLPENNARPDWRYGYTEQMVPPALPSSTAYQNKGNFNSDASGQVTLPIYHSLGQYGGSQASTGASAETWNYFPFNDRDFTSVAELLLVPGCPPGLFTKQFVEFAASTDYSTLFSGVTPLVTPPSLSSPPSVTAGQASNTFGTVIKPTASPYLIDKFFYSAADLDSVNPTNNVDNPTSAGWYKMFEFFEVPSQAMGAYGPVAQGANFDWYRQDLKPGLLNLNLIMDEEVFFSVLGKQNSSYVQQLLNTEGPVALGDIPKIVTGVDASTGSIMSYSMTNVGTGFVDSGANTGNLKPAFIEFLKVRHGGSGYLFGFGTGGVGSTTDIPADRPFRSLSYPDINLTVMRPAALPPSASSTPPWTDSDNDPTNGQQLPATQPTGTPGFVYDPGLKNPYRYPGLVSATAPAANVLPPAIPARRLFQAPDNYANSNASLTGDVYINKQVEDGKLLGDASPPYLTNNPTNDATRGVNYNLGAGASAPDNSQQPYFRTEMLQKVMNLTTVRTHQYAVWITVGFFEVTRQGNPEFATSTDPSQLALSYDQLGREIGLDGKIVRYRGFYVVDRTKATGFDPSNPGDHRACVVYGHVIQ